jgi:NADH dehydrogenase [ubiquinone] 1 alpha subcomplex assembly factor 7
VSRFAAQIRELIASEGPISVERYMDLCLRHYYATRDPFGIEGDFTTAPEISQMFGELLGLWATEVWRLMGAPGAFGLVELGPGRGTLMADLIRAARLVPGFLAAAQVHLVETSPVLRERQRSTLGRASPAPVWHQSIDTLPDRPLIIIANEFFDALPVAQYVATERGWCERMVGSDGKRLVFGLRTASTAQPPAPREGEILEEPCISAAITADLARRIAGPGGVLLAIDYGYLGPAFGDTLQAVRRHGFVDPLENPGEADLTVHVDFSRLARIGEAAGLRVHGPSLQGDFLRALGIESRAAALGRRATPAQNEAITGALRRLTGSGRDEMGGLFKVIALAHPSVASIPGLLPADGAKGAAS